MEYVEFIKDQLIVWWQFTLVGIITIIGLIVNMFDGNKNKKCINFKYKDMPQMKPILIPTKGKGFFGALWMWLIGVRHWEITKDFHYSLGKDNFIIPKGFQFDGASVPKFLSAWLSPVGVLLIGGLVHDYAYKYQTLLKKGKKTVGPWLLDDPTDKLTQKQADVIFRDINIEQNGFVVMNYLAYWALRVGGFVAWNGHRKRDENK